jgi:hypothetical protein
MRLAARIFAAATVKFDQLTALQFASTAWPTKSGIKRPATTLPKIQRIPRLS